MDPLPPLPLSFLSPDPSSSLSPPSPPFLSLSFFLPFPSCSPPPPSQSLSLSLETGPVAWLPSAACWGFSVVFCVRACSVYVRTRAHVGLFLWGWDQMASNRSSWSPWLPGWQSSWERHILQPGAVRPFLREIMKKERNKHKTQTTSSTFYTFTSSSDPRKRSPRFCFTVTLWLGSRRNKADSFSSLQGTGTKVKNISGKAEAPLSFFPFSFSHFLFPLSHFPFSISLLSSFSFSLSHFPFSILPLSPFSFPISPFSFPFPFPFSFSLFPSLNGLTFYFTGPWSLL